MAKGMTLPALQVLRSENSRVYDERTMNTETIVSQKLSERSLKISNESNYFWTQFHSLF